MSSLAHFLAASQRHWFRRHLVECLAIGIALGGAAAALLTSLLLFRRQSSLSLAIVLPSIGAACGATIAFATKPSNRRVIEGADRMLGNDELLATAWALRDSSEPWHRIIRQLADVRCAAVSPARIVPRRIGGRGWSMIGATVSAAAVMSAISVIGAGNRAIAQSPPLHDDWSRWTATLVSADAAHAPDGAALAPNPIEAAAGTTPETRSFNSESPAHAFSVTNTPPQQIDAAPGDGSGGGLAMTKTADAAVPDWMMYHRADAEPSATPGANGQPQIGGGKPVSGDGEDGIAAAIDRPSPAGATGPTDGTASISPRPLPPWAGIDPHKAGDATVRDAGSGKRTLASSHGVPFRCRDLASAYFSPS